MKIATLTTKFQVSIPKQIRDQLNLHAGQKIMFITKGEGIHLVPMKSIKDVRGLLAGANTKNIRDRKDRV